MLNENLIYAAMKKANDYLEAEGIYETDVNLRKRAVDWYSNTEITDVLSLAAMIIFGDYKNGLRISDIEAITSYYFWPVDEDVAAYIDEYIESDFNTDFCGF